MYTLINSLVFFLQVSSFFAACLDSQRSPPKSYVGCEEHTMPSTLIPSYACNSQDLSWSKNDPVDRSAWFPKNGLMG